MSASLSAILKDSNYRLAQFEGSPYIAELEKSYRVFRGKLEDGTLEVRKTREPNHAKMYLFYISPEKSATGQGGFAEANCRCGGLNEKKKHLTYPPQKKTALYLSQL